MKNRNQMETEDNFIEQKLAEAFGYGDAQLAEEMDHAVEAAKEDPWRAPAGELQKIMDRIDKAPTARHKVVRMRKMVKVLVAAAVLGAMVIGGGMWVGAKRYYVQDVRDRADIQNVVVFNNDENNLVDSSEIERAYIQTEEKLNSKILELSYLPEDMVFRNVAITRKKSVIEFGNGINKLFLTQGINDKPSSLSYGSDMEAYKKVYNSFLDKEILIYQDELENGENGFSIRIIEGDRYYFLEGIIGIEDFEQIVCGIKLYESNN